MDLEIALSGVSAEIQPHGLLQPGRRCVETSGDVIENVFTESAFILSSFFLTRPAICGLHLEREHREAEVLVWIAQGKGNYEIGVILSAQTRTICKHVEHILNKLNVENRTAAAAIALAVCSQLLDFL